MDAFVVHSSFWGRPLSCVELGRYAVQSSRARSRIGRVAQGLLRLKAVHQEQRAS